MVHGNPFYISLVGPVALIIVFNTYVLCVVIVKLHKHYKEKIESEFSQLITDARIAFTCNILLGTTWVFALFAVGKATMMFHWLFCIFNSLQGFFIFIFYTVRNPDLQKLLLRKLKKESKPSGVFVESSTWRKEGENNFDAYHNLHNSHNLHNLPNSHYFI